MIHNSHLFFAFLLSFASHNIMQASQVSQVKNHPPEIDLLLLRSINKSSDVAIATGAQKALALGANVNAQDKNGDTILILASQRNHLNTVQLLINTQPDLDVNLANHKGKTPLNASMIGLSLYSSSGSISGTARSHDIIKLLVASGATFDVAQYEIKKAETFIHQAYNYENELIEKQIFDAYNTGRAIFEQRKKELAAYEHDLTNNMHQCLQENLIPDLVNIVTEYTGKMSILQFVAYQKQNAAK